MNIITKKRVVKPGDIFQIDFGNNLFAYFVAFTKKRGESIYGGFFSKKEDIEIHDYKLMMKNLVFYGRVDWEGIKNGEWKYVENLQLPENFKLPPMRFLQREEFPDGSLGPLKIFIVDPRDLKDYPPTDENIDELEDAHLYCGYGAAEKRVLARLKGRCLRLTIKEIEDDPNDLASIKERRFAEAYDKYEKIEKYDDLRLLYKAINAYIKNDNDNIIPVFDSKNHNKVLKGEWDPAVNREIKKALKRKWVYQTVPAVIGKNINEVDIYKPILEVKNAAHGKGLPRYVDKRGVILYDGS